MTQAYKRWRILETTRYLVAAYELSTSSALYKTPDA